MWNAWADFSNVTFVSRTTMTLQVVSNPILERTFTAPNGSTILNPIHDQAFASLAALGADLVRYVPWFPYPKQAVAELDPPLGGETSWNWTYIMPMLEDFMDAVYGHGHSTVINFSTQPCWLVGDADGQPQDCSYPGNPDESFFNYVRGDRKNLLDPSANDLADYYGRLLSYLIKGEFVDEAGVRHMGGPKYNLSHVNGHTWELFNEAEHGYNVQQYTQDYDIVVSNIIDTVGGLENAPSFMGIGGASPGWIVPFLNASEHKYTEKIPPIDYISLHFYATCANRTDPSTYSTGFFGQADDFVQRTKTYIRQRDASDFPNVKFDLNELGVIMPNDNDPSFGRDANLPDIYWNAAGAMYAYLFSQLAPLGVEVLGQSQLAGSPKIPEWGIPFPQYPSVSLLDWRTGLGNARYWVLKLLLEEFHAGDSIVDAMVTAAFQQSANDLNVSVDVLAVVSSLQQQQKVLIINKELTVQNVSVAAVFGNAAVTLRIVDPLSVQTGSARGIREDRISDAATDMLVVQPFGVVVVVVVVVVVATTTEAILQSRTTSVK
jgi:hypothetical protein